MLRVRRRPLLGAAMVGGGAYMAGKNRQRSMERESDQEARLQELEYQQGGGYGGAPPPPAPPAPPPAPVAAAAPVAAPAAPGGDMVSKLKELKELLDAGVLTQDEFDTAKQKLLAS